MPDMFKKANFLAGFFILFFVFFLSSLFFIDNIKFNEFQGDASAQVASSDAIALRVIPNPEHYSPGKWYDKQNFSGNPKAIKVDGYEAIQDGRTVYVNAANIVGSDLYTNIYLISYNQEAEGVTASVFDRIIDNWKFNTNISSPGNCIDKDGYSGEKCILDDECSNEEYCNNQKSEIIRDVRRMADLRDIEDLLEVHSVEYGYYPKMAAGSYLSQISLSVWPSWQKVLAQELGGSLPVDPLNLIGECGEARFNETTCWDDEKKEFAGNYVKASNDGMLPTLDLAVCSRVYLYKASVNGLSYEVCAAMESGYIYGCSGVGGDASGGIIERISGNSAPFFTQNSLEGKAGESYLGFIEASDADGDSLIFNINTSGVDWNVSGWSAVPVLNTTASPNQISIYAEWAGKPDNYIIKMEVDDGMDFGNSKTSKNFVIKITNQAPIVSVYNPMFPASTTNYIEFKMKAKDGLPTQILTHSLISGTLLDGLSSSWWQDAGTGEYNYQVVGFLDDTNDIPMSTGYPYTLAVTDSFGATASENFILTITNGKPIMKPLMCEIFGRAGDPYICNTYATEPDNNLITSFNGVLPTGLNIDSGTGVISGIFPSINGQYNLSVFATDEFGAVSDSVFLSLSSDTFCGDGIIQKPNSEGRGGEDDNGYEDCEGLSGVAVSTGDSSENKQYACTSACPETGSCLNTCSFTGGWCGDNAVNGPESCDDGFSNTDTPCAPAYDSDCAYCGSGCSTHTVVSTEYCGNGIIDGPEECDISLNDIVAITNALEAKSPGITNGLAQAEIIVIYENSCASDCSILGCLSDATWLGTGCYLGQTSIGEIVSSCQKGKWSCVGDTVVCNNVYNTPGHPDYIAQNIFDYCCLGTPEVFSGLSYSLRRGTGLFNCDNVCRGFGEVCIGIGLDDIGHECNYIIDHSGSVCSGFNLSALDDCKKDYSVSTALCVEPTSGISFSVGETGCYCY